MVDAIVLISPNGGEVWSPGSTHNITWARTGTTLGTGVKLELWKGGILDKQIIYETPIASGSYSWTIPTTQALGTDYKIRIMGCTLSSSVCIDYPSDMSDAYFTIGTVSSVLITSPTVGTFWEKGKTYNITWTGVGIYPHPKIELYKGNTFNREIVYSSPTVGTYSWTVPTGTDLVVGTDYKINIVACSGTDVGCDADRTYLSNMSNSFTISIPIIVCNIPKCNLIIR